MPDENSRRALRRYRSRHPLGLHPEKSPQDHSVCPRLPGHLARDLPIRITKLLTENEPQAKFQRSHRQGARRSSIASVRFAQERRDVAHLSLPGSINNVWLYNHHLPQKAPGHITPIKAMKKWYADKSDLFLAKSRNRSEPDNPRHFT